MTRTFDAAAAARFIADAHRGRAAYRNLPDALAPRSVADAYSTQEALREIWIPIHGPVAGLKIATTTKVMQQLMGIDHPCGGVIYANRVHASPHDLELSHFVHVAVECELAVRVSAALPKRATQYAMEDVRRAVGAVMPAFELIEDRNAVYRETRALSLIADNAWNGGIVLGKPVDVAEDLDLNGLKGRLTTAAGTKEGLTDDPMGALAWLANLAADRGKPLEAGQVVITGSIIATLPIAAGETFSFEIAGLGHVQLTAH
ncbi:MAG: fumarylacetoacetate hydrolase family protein [Betaproteobacteria bacterium]